MAAILAAELVASGLLVVGRLAVHGKALTWDVGFGIQGSVFRARFRV